MKDAVYTNGSTDQTSPAFVLDHQSPDDVANAMIEYGQQKQPFYIFNMDEAFLRTQHFRELMPRIKIFYAMHSNDTEMMLKLTISLGLGFSCMSPGEIYKLRQLRVNPRSMVYSLPCKTPTEMMYARKAGIKHTTFDSSYELKKFQQFWLDAKLLIRIRIEENNNNGLGEKFGCDFETEAIDLLEEAINLGLEVVGVAFHVGNNCSSLKANFVTGLKRARVLFDHEASAGRRMNIVDIGGGFLSDRTDRIDEISRIINFNLEELFPDPTVQVIAEPGRYLCDSAFKAFCSITGVKRIIRNNVPINMIYMNDGRYGTMWCSEKWHKIIKLQRSPQEANLEEDTILWGPSCDSIDRVMLDHKVQLPACTANDWLVIDNHGAYSFSFTTKFSSLELPLIRPVISKELWNYIKTSSVFDASDFVIDPDISVPLMSTLPPVLPQQEVYDHSSIPTLNS